MESQGDSVSDGLGWGVSFWERIRCVACFQALLTINRLVIYSEDALIGR